MPEVLFRLAARARRRCGLSAFAPDACLVNPLRARHPAHAPPGPERAGLRRTDRLGVARRAGDRFCGAAPRARTGRAAVRLEHGDVVVWGGPARLHFHGIDTAARSPPPADREHALPSHRSLRSRALCCAEAEAGVSRRSLARPHRAGGAGSSQHRHMTRTRPDLHRHRRRHRQRSGRLLSSRRT